MHDADASAGGAPRPAVRAAIAGPCKLYEGFCKALPRLLQGFCKALVRDPRTPHNRRVRGALIRVTNSRRTHKGAGPMAQWKTELVPPAPQIAVDHMGQGKLVICMHGIGGNRTNWHDQLPEFSRHFHVGSWDARGYGMSDDYEGPLDFHDFARDLVRVLDHFSARKAHLVGLSMGGLIAMDFNALFPERVATLTLCGSLPGFGP